VNVVAQKTKVCPPDLASVQPVLTAADTASKTITTTTKASAFPSLLRQKRSAIQIVERSDMKNEAVIQVTCPECGRKEVRYSAVQLRSADEGSTIFYTCDCGHKCVEFGLGLYLIANIRKMEHEQLSRSTLQRIRAR
jgi:DNA-directed RNA polymerase subunit M/transcription elongation factor TFIIS